MTDQEFLDLVRKSKKSLNMHALKFTYNKQDANDLVQETILKAFEKKEKFKEIENANFGGWIYFIMRNIFIDQKRKGKKQGHSKEISELSLEDKALIGIDFNKACEKIDSVIIDKALKDLPFNLRESLLLYIKGYLYREIAEIQKLPLDNVKSNIFRARKILREQLKEFRYN